MNCAKCGTEMVPGKAIRPDTEHGALHIVQQPMITAETMELIDVLKCPACGHSDDGVEP